MLTSQLQTLPNTFSHSFTTHNSNIKEIGGGCVLRPLRFHTSQTHILSDLTQTHTELLHIQSVFIITHKPDGANMLTSQLHILSNTFSHSFTTHNSNIKEIGGGCVLRPLRFHTSQTHILSDLTQTHTELLHIQSVFIITHKPDGANMLTSQLHILSNTFSLTLPSHHFNLTKIGQSSHFTLNTLPTPS